MKLYCFTIQITGGGDTKKEAWDNATEETRLDKKECPEEDYIYNDTPAIEVIDDDEEE